VTVRRDDLSRWVSGALLVGGLVSIAIVAIGVVFSLEAMTRAGLLVVVLTPIGRLTAAGAAFLRHREVRYAGATAIVLSLLVGGLVIAIATSGSGA
jgi:uncharacterized membrane protein